MILKGSTGYWAWVTLDPRGLVQSGSTVTVDGETWSVPDRSRDGTVIAMSRIGEALKERGWKPVRGGVHDRESRPGLVGIPVERIEEG